MQYKDGAALSYPKIEYTYNADGMITGVRHCYYINGSTEYYYDSEYILDGTRVLAYRSGDDRGSFYAEYLYDESGSPMGMKYYAYNFETNQTETTCAYYFFEKNIFGDIVGVYDEDGNKVLGFTYDAWGNFSITETSEISGLYEGYRTFLTKACIFRYRGYMYESSSELYYLQTRFYDPVVGRFLNADGYVSTGQELIGNNMYIYCGNDPINRIDPSGLFWKEIGDWFSNTFGGAVYVSNSYENISFDSIYAGFEAGESTSRVIAGDNSKPITFYAQNASEWWKFWEYKVGININIGEGGYNFGIGVGEMTMAVCANNTSVELVVGPRKLGVTISQDVDFKNHTAGVYEHYYIRPWTIALTAAAVYATGGALAPAASAPLLPI